MLSALAWWAVLALLGLLALPYLTFAFRRLPDRGLAFGKIAGALLLGYLLWVLGTVRVVPNGRGAAALALVLLAVGALLLWRRQGRRLIAFLRWQRGTLVLYEAVFLAGFLFWAFVRAHNPEIEGTEKPMDFALLNTAVRSESFPPADPWLSGHPVNYYYFGYLIVGGIAQLSGQAAAVAFNLGLATLFGSAAVGAWGLGMNLARLHGRTLKQAALYGGVAAGFLLLMGNLEGTLELLRWHGAGPPQFWGWLNLKGDTDQATGRWRLLEPAPDPGGSADSWYPADGWWWWRATRVIDTLDEGESRDYTITEFPFFSFLLGDLHPHLLALPVALLGLGLCLELLLARPRRFRPWLRAWPGSLLPAVFVFGSLGFINGWDLVPYLCLYAGIGLLAMLTGAGATSWGWFALWCALLGAGAFVLYGPFYFPLALQLLSPLAGGESVQGFPIAWWSGPGTRPAHFLLLWVPFALAAGLLLWVRSPRTAVIAGAFLGVGWLVLELLHGSAPTTPLHRVWPLVPAAAAFVLAVKSLDRPALAFALALVGAAFLLFAVNESLYIRDVFGNRMNTVFKLSYQAWVFLAVAAAFTVCFVNAQRAALAALLAVVLLACVYPVTALPAKADGFRGEPTLDGLAHLRKRDPAEAEALGWIAARIPRRGGVVLEATGGQYTHHGRVSGSTGVPTVLGWAGHEVQWRGGDRLLRGRAEDIDRIYLALDKAEVRPLLDKYGVDYVYVGSLERAKYPDPALSAFSGAMEVAFQNTGVTIYRTSRS